MKFKRLFPALFSAFILLSGCGYGTTNNNEASGTNIIPDSDFEWGFTVLSQKDHANGDLSTELGRFTYSGINLRPSWKLAQWDSGPCLWANNVSEDKYTISDGASKWVTYNPDSKSLLLRLNTEPYYQGKGAVAGDYWPHLLIEQTFPFDTLTETDRFMRTGGVDKINFSMDIRMPYYSATPNADNWVEAAQLYVYFGVVDKLERKFVWFGLQLFDSRYEYSKKTYHIDSGKEDSSGLPVYLIGMEDVYASSKNTLWKKGAPTASDKWVHVSLDLKPHLADMMQIAVENGYFRENIELSDLYFHYMNLGWETIATFDCGVEIKNLNLNTQYTKK